MRYIVTFTWLYMAMIQECINKDWYKIISGIVFGIIRLLKGYKRNALAYDNSYEQMETKCRSLRIMFNMSTEHKK